MAAWDPLGWLQDLGWYRELLRADWFAPLRPYWLRYRLDWVVGGLILLFSLLLLRKLFRAMRGRNRLSRKMPPPASVASVARDLARKGEVELAAETYLGAGKTEKALELFLSIPNYARAAAAQEKLGKLDQAMDLFERAGDTSAALRLAVMAGQLDRAAMYHRQRGTFAQAAQMYLDAGQAESAADLFAEAGLLMGAAAALAGIGKHLEAAEHLLAYMKASANDLGTAEDGLVQRCCKALMQADRPRDAALLYQAGQWYARAAEQFLAAGDEKQAAVCFEKEENWASATALYRHLGDRKNWIRTLEKVRDTSDTIGDLEWVQALEEAGMTDRAADCCRRLGLVDAAIECYQQAGRPASAAELLAENGRHVEACRLYLQTGEPLAAREQAQAAGDKLLAAQSAFEAGMFFEAGQEFYTAGDFGWAIEALQKVEDSHPETRVAASLLGQAFQQMGDAEMSLRMHSRAVEGLDIGRSNLELFYRLARFLEKVPDQQERARARQIYGDILAADYAFRDTKSRLRHLDQRRDRVAPV